MFSVKSLTVSVKKKKKNDEKKSYPSNFCLIWLLEYNFVQLEELRMIICIRDVSLLNQHWASVRQLTEEALIGLKAHLIWFILNILYASQTLRCKRKDITSLSFFPQSGLSASLRALFLWFLSYAFVLHSSAVSPSIFFCMAPYSFLSCINILLSWCLWPFIWELCSRSADRRVFFWNGAL